jgi:hypothetical protein
VDRGFHRQSRVEAITRWSSTGLTTPRGLLPVERDYRDRIDRLGSWLFRPLALPYSDDTAYNLQVSYLVDAYDALASRPDIAFDSAWKAWESLLRTSPLVSTANVTDMLRSVATRGLDPITLKTLMDNPPAQTCEYLFKRIVATDPGDTAGMRNVQRLTGHPPFDATFTRLRSALRRKYIDTGPTLDQARRGAMALRLILRGDAMSIGGDLFELDLPHRLHLLLSGLLYTARNERFHGSSFSPFISSDTTLRTYCHPHYLFVCSYSLVHLAWTTTSSIPVADVQANVEANMREAVRLYRRHWRR